MSQGRKDLVGILLGTPGPGPDGRVTIDRAGLGTKIGWQRGTITKRKCHSDWVHWWLLRWLVATGHREHEKRERVDCNINL